MGKALLRGFIVALVATAAGFAFGRFGIGEYYLGKQFANFGKKENLQNNTPAQTPVRSVQTPEPTPNIHVEAPPLPGEPGYNGSNTNNHTGAADPNANNTDNNVITPDDETTPVDENADNRTPVQYSLQAGSFDTKKAADERASEVSGAGYAARVQQEGTGDEVVYRVLVGNYPTESAARRDAEHMRNDGFDVFVSRTKR
jgi:cell division protein FtsN